MQLASINVFYSMWLLENIIFHKSLLLLLDSFNSHIVALFEASVLKEVRILRFFQSVVCYYQILNLYLTNFRN